jgi:hypothetical protein
LARADRLEQHDQLPQVLGERGDLSREHDLIFELFPSMGDSRWDSNPAIAPAVAL